MGNLSAKQFDTADGVLNVFFLILSAVFVFKYSKHYVQIKHVMADGMTLYMKLIMNSSIVLVVTYFVRYLMVTTFSLIKHPGDGALRFNTTMKDVLFVVGHSTFYLIMTLRLYFVFKGSKYALRRCAQMLLSSLWTSVLVVNVLFFVFSRGDIGSTQSQNVFFFMLALLDVIFAAVLIVIFTQKLIEMGVDSEDMSHREPTQTASDRRVHSPRPAAGKSLHAQQATVPSGSHFDAESDSDDLFSDHGAASNGDAPPPPIDRDHERAGATATERQQQRINDRSPSSVPGPRPRDRKLTETQTVLVAAATKYALLCGSTVLVLDLQFLSQAISNLDGDSNYGVELFLEIWFWSALLLMFYTIYLSFPTTLREYDRVCGRLHSMLQGIFSKNMRRKIDQKEAVRNNEARTICCCGLQRDL